MIQLAGAPPAAVHVTQQVTPNLPETDFGVLVELL